MDLGSCLLVHLVLGGLFGGFLLMFCLLLYLVFGFV